MKSATDVLAKESTITEDAPVLQGICTILEEADVEYLFGLPGGNISKIYPYLYGNKKITPILVRHEQVASIMAEVYGRLTGKTGVYASQGAWAVTNGTMGAIEALLGSSPMLILADMSDNSPFSHHAPYQVGTGEYGGYDVKKSMEAVTKNVTAAYYPEQAIQGLQLAFKHSLSGNPGPVSVIFHSHSIGGTLDNAKTSKIYHTKHYLQVKKRKEDLIHIKNACDTLMNAKTPFIIAGNGLNIAKANEELKMIAELLGSAVGTTAGGKSAMAETHDLSVGVMGNWGQDVANKLLAESDVVFAIGSRLTPTDTVFESQELINPTNQTMIQLDVEEKHAGWTYPVDQSLIGDAKEILNQMIDYIRENKKSLQSDKIRENYKRIIDEKATCKYMDVADHWRVNSPISLRSVVKEIEDISEEKTKITLDSGENRVFMTNLFKTKSANSIISPTASGAMGYAIPAALATKLVYPDEEVIAVCGDGGFPMTMNALLTAQQYDLKIIVVVMNNSGLGWVKSNQGDKPIASEYPHTDFSTIAESFGCKGIRVEQPGEIAGALKRATESDVTTVVDIVTTDTESYKDVQSALLRKTNE